MKAGSPNTSETGSSKKVEREMMTRAQIVLTTAEFKKLITQAVSGMEPIRRALHEDMVVIHPNRTTYFLIEHFTGKRPEGIWLVGMIARRGACVEGMTQKAFEEDRYQELTKPENFPFSWVFKKGKDLLENEFVKKSYLGM